MNPPLANPVCLFLLIRYSSIGEMTISRPRLATSWIEHSANALYARQLEYYYHEIPACAVSSCLLGKEQFLWGTNS